MRWLAIGLALALTGCGATTTKTVTASTPVITTAAQAHETALKEAREQREVNAREKTEAREEAAKKRVEEDREKFEHEHEAAAQNEATEGTTVPNETSVRLDVAEEGIESAGLSYKVVGGGLFGVVVKSHWTVCETKPSAGTPLSAGGTVRLIVARSC